MPVLGSSWRPTVQKAPDPVVPTTGPARAITVDDTYVNRKAREFRTDHPSNPSEDSVDGRAQQIEKNVAQSQTPKGEDVAGFVYSASVRNDSGKNVKVVFWEYRFTEKAKPENVSRRQFICGVNLKKSDKMELSAFSRIGPSDTVDAASLAKSNGNVFDERVQVNRVEFSDGTVLQRGSWKYADYQAAIERATSTSWGNEVCRAF